METTRYDIWTPDAGDQYALTVDMGIFAQDVDDTIWGVTQDFDNTLLARDASLDKSIRTVDSMLARDTLIPAPATGDRVFRSDLNTWQFYDGAGWVSQGLIRPTSVSGTGVSIGDGGVVEFAGATNIYINGVFSTRYRLYELNWHTSRSGTNVEFCRLRNSGSDRPSNYASRRVFSTGAGFNEQVTIGAGWDFSPTPGRTFSAKTVRLLNPGHAEFTRVVGGSGMESDGSSLTNVISLAGEHREAVASDGFTIYPSSSGTFSGTLTVRGLA